MRRALNIGCWGLGLLGGRVARLAEQAA